MEEDKKDFHNRLKKNKIERNLLNLIYKIILYADPMIKSLSKDGREELKNSNYMNIIFNREYRIGMLTGTILSNSQFTPIPQTNDYMFESSKAGELIGVDYLRQEELGEKAITISKGSLFGCLLEEIENKSIEEYTPTGLLNLFDVMHSLQLETPSLEKLIKGEYIEPISYTNALKSVGQYENLASIISNSEIQHKEVYQVTPKGNGLLFLESKFGEPSPKKTKNKIPMINRPAII
jgi:hypothetical protein